MSNVIYTQRNPSYGAKKLDKKLVLIINFWDKVQIYHSTRMSGSNLPLIFQIVQFYHYTFNFGANLPLIFQLIQIYHHI